MVTIELSDGTIIENLTLNGDNFVSQTEITEDIFEDNLDGVTITIDGDETFHPMMKLIQVTPMFGDWWFVLQDVSKAEYRDIEIDAKFDYLSMMTGIDLF